MVVALGGPGVLEPRSYTERYLSWQINDPSRSPMRGTVMKKIAAVITTSVLLVSVGNAAASAREAHSRGGDRGTEVTRVEVPEAPEVEAPETDAAVEAPEAAEAPEVEAAEVDAAEEAPEAAELEAPEVDAAAEAPEAAEVEVPEVDAAADEAPEAADAP